MYHAYMISIQSQTEFKVYSAQVTRFTLSWFARNVSYLHVLPRVAAPHMVHAFMRFMFHSATVNLRWTLLKLLASPCLSSEAYNTQ